MQANNSTTKEFKTINVSHYIYSKNGITLAELKANIDTLIYQYGEESTFKIVSDFNYEIDDFESLCFVIVDK